MVGIRTLRDVQTQTKLTHGPLSTPHYFAPEVLNDASQVDVRADVWAAGIVLYEMLARATPWESKSFLTLLTEIARGQIPDVRPFCPWELPDELVAVLRRALQVDPGMRYRDANEFARAIRALDLRKLMALTTAHRKDGVTDDRWREPSDPADRPRALCAARVANLLSYADALCVPQRIMNMLRWALDLDREAKITYRGPPGETWAYIEPFYTYMGAPDLPAAFYQAMRSAGFDDGMSLTWGWQMPSVPSKSYRTES